MIELRRKVLLPVFQLTEVCDAADPLAIKRETQLQRRLPTAVVAQPLAVDPEQLRTVCDQLVAMLENDEGDAVDLLAAHEGLLQAAFPGSFIALRDAVQGFDFEAALGVMRDCEAR